MFPLLPPIFITSYIEQHFFISKKHRARRSKSSGNSGNSGNKSLKALQRKGFAVPTLQKTVGTSWEQRSKTMDFEQILDLAKRNEPPEQFEWTSEQMTYQAIRFLIERCRLGKVKDEDARRQLREIKQAFSHSKNIEQYAKHCADLWMNISNAAIEFNRERTIEAAEKMCEIIYRMKVSDKHD